MPLLLFFSLFHISPLFSCASIFHIFFLNCRYFKKRQVMNVTFFNCDMYKFCYFIDSFSNCIILSNNFFKNTLIRKTIANIFHYAPSLLLAGCYVTNVGFLRQLVGRLCCGASPVWSFVVDVWPLSGYCSTCLCLRMMSLSWFHSPFLLIFMWLPLVAGWPSWFGGYQATLSIMLAAGGGLMFVMLLLSFVEVLLLDFVSLDCSALLLAPSETEFLVWVLDASCC